MHVPSHEPSSNPPTSPETLSLSQTPKPPKPPLQLENHHAAALASLGARLEESSAACSELEERCRIYGERAAAAEGSQAALLRACDEARATQAAAAARLQDANAEIGRLSCELGDFQAAKEEIRLLQGAAAQLGALQEERVALRSALVEAQAAAQEADMRARSAEAAACHTDQLQARPAPPLSAAAAAAAADAGGGAWRDPPPKKHPLLSQTL